MTYKQFIRYYGTQMAAVRATGLPQPTVAAWQRRGYIPILAQLQIERFTHGKLRADPLPELAA